MKQNDSLGANKRPVIYLDETWIHAHYTDVGVRRNDSPGRRWIIVHTGSEAGFVENALLMFKADTKTGNYHDQMNAENFTVAFRKITTQYTPELHNCDGQRPLSQ